MSRVTLSLLENDFSMHLDIFQGKSYASEYSILCRLSNGISFIATSDFVEELDT